MSDDQESNPAESESSSEGVPAEDRRSDGSAVGDAVSQQEPEQVQPVLADAHGEELDPSFDDRDVRVPYSEDDGLAESPRLATFDPPSMDASSRGEVGRSEPEPSEDLPVESSYSPSPELPDSNEAIEASEEEDDEGRQMAATDAALDVTSSAAEPGKQLAHKAFIEAVEAHASTLGLKVKSQSSFIQFLHDNTGHKIYVGKTVREGTPIRIESTLELVGVIEGASPIEKANGKIAVVLSPQLETVMRALNILASGSMGPVRAPRRTDQKSATK